MTIQDLRKKKKEGQKITMVTAYDCPFARMADMAGIDTILVGDSVGNNVLGYGSTVPVTMDEMVHHVKAVTRGAKNAWVIADMPYMSYQVTIEEAVRNAGRFIKECDADAVKLEGGVDMADVIRAITRAGIPVVAHIGLTPQTVAMLGGLKVQGKTAEAAKKLLEDGLALQEAGAVMIVLEAIPAHVAAYITENIDIPTIGIGAGPHCDGQVLVMHDLLGLNSGFVPKFCKQYAQLEGVIVEAFAAYKTDVESGAFPEEKHCFTIKEEELKKLY